MAYEQPQYEIVQANDGYGFELRQYKPYIVAEVAVSGDFGSVGNKAFRILAGYIGGNNKLQQSIPMTAPVTQSPASDTGEKIAMTAPVEQTPQAGNDSTYLFSFMMPTQYSLDTLPTPNDPRISIRQVESRRMAARTYSGTWSEERYRRNETALLDAISAAGLQPIGEPVFARYNSPFTLWFMRRNEVLVEIKQDGIRRE